MNTTTETLLRELFTKAVHARGLKKKDIYAMSDVHPSTVSKVLSGQNGSAEVFVRMIKPLNLNGSEASEIVGEWMRLYRNIPLNYLKAKELDTLIEATIREMYKRIITEKLPSRREDAESEAESNAENSTE